MDGGRSIHSVMVVSGTAFGPALMTQWSSVRGDGIAGRPSRCRSWEEESSGNRHYVLPSPRRD
eukprot:gene58321-biopygen79348